MELAIMLMLYGLAGLLCLSAVGIAVYLIGAKMKAVKDAHERVENRAAIWGWGFIYSILALVLLFLIIRFVKFAWTI